MKPPAANWMNPIACRDGLSRLRKRVDSQDPPASPSKKMATTQLKAYVLDPKNKENSLTQTTSSVIESAPESSITTITAGTMRLLCFAAVTGARSALGSASGEVSWPATAEGLSSARPADDRASAREITSAPAAKRKLKAAATIRVVLRPR